MSVLDKKGKIYKNKTKTCQHAALTGECSFLQISMSVWWTVCYVTMDCVETLLAPTPAPVLKALSSNLTRKRVKVSFQHWHMYKHAHVHTVLHPHVFCHLANERSRTLFPDVLPLVPSKHSLLMEKANTPLGFNCHKVMMVCLPLSPELRCVLNMFQISTSVSRARASMECVVMWPGPSTASALMAASWTPPTPSAWVSTVSFHWVHTN